MPTDLENHLILNKKRLSTYALQKEEINSILESRIGTKIREVQIKTPKRDKDAMDVDSDEDSDDDIIIEDFKQDQEEEDRKKIAQFESYMVKADTVAKILEEPKLLQQISAMAWWAQPGKWKPSSTWEASALKSPWANYYWAI